MIWTKVHRIGAGDKRGIASDVLRASQAVSCRRIEITIEAESMQVRNLRSIERTAIVARDGPGVVSKQRSQISRALHFAKPIDTFFRRPWNGSRSPERVTEVFIQKQLRKSSTE